MAYTGKERVMAAYRREYADRVPIFAGVGPHLLDQAGVSPHEYLTNQEKMLDVAKLAQEQFPSDIIVVPGNPALPEMQAMMRRLAGQAPVRHRLANKADLSTLPLRKPEEDRYVAPHLEMCEKTKRVFTDEVLETIVGGPWSIAMDLRGTEQLIYDTADDPQFVADLMAYTLQMSTLRSLAFIDLGIGVTIGEPSGSCSLISPKLFRKFVKPYHLQFVEGIKKARNAPITLHMCGYIDPIMEDLTELGYDRIEIDAPSSLKKMVEVTKKKTVVRGNIAAQLFSEGTKEEMERAVKECVDVAAEGSGYILSQGCAIPANAPLQNIRNFLEAAVKYGTYGPAKS